MNVADQQVRMLAYPLFRGHTCGQRAQYVSDGDPGTFDHGIDELNLGLRFDALMGHTPNGWDSVYR